MADVLVVEDEESLSHTLRYNLSRTGHEVRLCTRGRVALEKMLSNLLSNAVKFTPPGAWTGRWPADNGRGPEPATTCHD